MPTDRYEVVPTKLTDATPADVLARPLSRQPHYVRRVDGHNGKTESTRQVYTRRDNAVRGAVAGAAPEGLPVHILDRAGNLIRPVVYVIPKGTP